VAAKVGEAPPVSGWPDDVVRFPGYLERKYELKEGKVVGLAEVEIPYQHGVFKYGNRGSDGFECYYYTNVNDVLPRLSKSPYSTIRYKDSDITVSVVQEVYDADDKTLLSFSHFYRTNLNDILHDYQQLS
jgi:hypothetical protein